MFFAPRGGEGEKSRNKNIEHMRDEEEEKGERGTHTHTGERGGEEFLQLYYRCIVTGVIYFVCGMRCSVCGS